MILSQAPQHEEEAEAFSERTLVFPGGIPGFPSLRRFRLVTDPEFSPPFELLTSDEEPGIGFYVIDPRLVDEGYDPEIPDADGQALLVQPDDEIALRAIVTVGRDPTSTTANLAAPVVLNLTAGLGVQSILENSGYSLRTPLLAPAD
ncbi:MAG: flagellar assembly protein FliW [Chloroflexi bacterium]|nr:flagellar assembly protein FliW [Chloroflexota bacterium]